MKILFTSVGRRVELVQAFKDAADRMNVSLTVVGADISESAPALFFCDEAVKVCRIDNPDYIPSLIRLCGAQHIDCLIPTIDTDLLLLSKHRSEFDAVGTRVLISDISKVSICRDKNYTADYFISLGLKSPRPVNSLEALKKGLLDGRFSFPVFIKPKDGSSSIDAYRADDLEKLTVYAEKIGDFIIQPFISGREYTVDIFCDFDGNPIYITPRERLAVRAGEVLKTRITQDDVMIREMLKLVENFKPCGQITVQLIREEKTGEDYYIEINPRFGGGAPLSMKAGADSAEALIRVISGEKPGYQEKAARDGEIYSRFDQSICVNPQ